MEINAIQDQIIEEFGYFDNWSDKYEYIIELGKKLPVLDEEHKTEVNKIKGCQSSVWLIGNLEGDKIVYKADSDSVIVKGLIALLVRVLSEHTPSEIIAADLYFIEKIGMTQHLAQTRSNGLLAMLKQMKFYAMAYQAKQMS